MKLVVRQAAEDDLDDIAEWIAKDNVLAAREMVARIRDQIGYLETDELVHRGRPGFIDGTRELLEYPYIIVYRVDERKKIVTVLSIVHGARDR